MFAVIAEGIKDLGESQMRKSDGNLFWGRAQPPAFDDSSNRRSSSSDNWLARQNLVVTDDIKDALLGWSSVPQKRNQPEPS